MDHRSSEQTHIVEKEWSAQHNTKWEKAQEQEEILNMLYHRLKMSGYDPILGVVLDAKGTTEL